MHRWREHDLVTWDNRCTMHRGTDYGNLRAVRDMQRATVSDVANSCEQEGIAVPAQRRSTQLKNASARASMLWRGGAPGGGSGRSNEVCGVKRARPSFSESNTLNTSASSRRISGK